MYYCNPISNDCISHIAQTAETVEAIVSQLMEKQRLARSGGGGVTAGPAVNGHASNIPQRHQQQQHQAGLGGRGSNRSSAEPAHHKVTADAATHNDLATSHSLPHSLRRLSSGGGGSASGGGGSFIRLEPRPAPSHSNNINSSQVI